MADFQTIEQVRQFVNDTIKANGTREITGPNVQDALIGIIDLLSPKLKTALTAQLGSGGSVGGVSTGTVFAQGSSIEDVLKAILTKGIPPTYTQPSGSLASTIGTFDQEIGSIISPQFSASFVQGDAGAQTGAILNKNGALISSSLPYTDSNVTLVGTLSYQALISYAQGFCKNNNLGTQDCSGRIVSGTIGSNTIVYHGYRKAFFGVPVSVPNNSAGIRSLSGYSLNPVNGTQFAINIPAGSVNVCFAFPASLQDVSSIKYVELSNTEIKGNFAQSSISVQGNNSYTAINYKVYVYTPVQPFTESATYLVTI